MDWPDPFRLGLLAFFGVVGVVFARFRAESPTTIAMNVGGYVLFMVGLWWASSLGRDALIAAGLASLGALSFTYAWARHERSRAGQAASSRTGDDAMSGA